jgi:mannose-6-phosphate isomerase-like protein (cupin superfamily)
MKGYKTNIENETVENTDFRKVLYTGKHLQLVLMAIEPGGEIGEEVHKENDQFFRVESGTGRCIIDGNEYTIEDGDAIVVPAGAKHNILNTDAHTPLQLYTIYGPSHHKDGIVHHTREEAEKDEEEFDGKTTE